MSNIKEANSDRLFNTLNLIFSAIILIIILYPLYLIFISSISNPNAVNTGKVTFWPKGLTFEGYKLTFQTPDIWLGYKHTLIYTVLNVILAVSIIIPCGYALSRKDFYGRNIVMFGIVFTMFFSGGIIPTYLIVQNLG